MIRSHSIFSVRLTLSVVLLTVVATAQDSTQAFSPIVAANTRFAFKFFRSLVTKTNDHNVLLAPTGLSSTFALLDNGADRDAREEIESTFELGGLSLQRINEGFASLQDALQLKRPKLTKRPVGMTPLQWKQFQAAPPNGTVVADSIWLRIPFPTSFLKINQNYYHADVKRMLATPAPWIQISNWARERTKKNVTIHPGTLSRNDFIFVDVTSFHSFWEDQFLEAETKPDTFTLLNGQTKELPLMHERKNFSYLETPKFQAVLLPYSDGTCMYVFLPSKDSNLSEFERTLTTENWQTWTSEFESRLGVVELPRFQTSSGFDLRAGLEEIGLKRVFETAGAFLPLVPVDGATLVSASQSTTLKVNERGTEAISIGLMGGVPGGVAGGQMGPPPKPFEMIVNRPFFFAIEHERTGQLLFLGAVLEP